MTLPRAVLAATAELAEIEAQLKAPEPEQSPQDGQTEPPPEPAATTESEQETQPEVTPSVPQPVVPEEKWEHKYKRLQGKYDAEVPRLHQQLREAQTAIQQLNLQLQQIQQSTPPALSKTPDKQDEPERYVSDEDVANYGEDFVDIQRRIALDATREMRKQLAELQAKLDAQSSQVQTVSFESRLQQAIKDFDEINADPEWIAWLNEVDPLLRGPRRIVAQAAYARGDVEAVKEYVDLFKKSRHPVPAKPEVSREKELARQVQPSRATASVPVNAQKTYTMSEADALFRRMQQLTAQGRFEEAKRLDAEISAAYQEGRVIV